MGGFYGSVQVRTEDRQAVVRAVSAYAGAAGIRILIGPLLDGWVGVYPQGVGQDCLLGQTLAEQLGGEVLQSAVLDDAVLAYWFWYDGELADAYWSKPGCFDPAEAAAQEQMSGDPQAFGDLTEGRWDRMFEILDRERSDIAFEADRLRQFFDFLGIRNGATSYEYLKAGEHAGIEAWEEFEEFPTEQVLAEQAAVRQRRMAVESKKQKLRADHLLLADVVEERLMPRACPTTEGMLVAWEGYGRGEARIEIFRQPWGEPEPGEIETGGHVNSVCSDPAGTRVAMGLGNRVVVWDAKEWSPILELVESNWAVETALSADGAMLAYQSREGVFVHDIDSGKRLTALSAHAGPALAFHPSGQWLLSAGSALWIARVDASDPWRELYPGGQVPLPPNLAQAVKNEMSHIDVDALQEKWRKSIEAAVEKLAAMGKETESGRQLIEKMRQQMEKQLGEMRAKFANLKKGVVPPPQEAIETTHCAGFTPDGEHLWLGTDQGLRVYAWAEVLETRARCEMPKPLLSYPRGAAGNGQSMRNLVYAAANVPGADALLFGGFDGKLREIDLSTGKVRELATPPDGGAIVGITVSPDASAVGVCSRPALGAGGDPRDERAVWEIWRREQVLVTDRRA